MMARAAAIVATTRSHWLTGRQCGECEYEESDGSRRWQCVACALADAFDFHVRALVADDDAREARALDRKARKLAAAREVAAFESEAKAQARAALVPLQMTAQAFEAAWLRLVRQGRIAYRSAPCDDTR